MNPKNHPSAYGYQPQGGYHEPKPFVQEDTLKAGTIAIERKTFEMVLKENPRGRFLRITEKGGSNHSSIIIPAPGLEDFQALLADMIKADAAATPKKEI
jgi:hypothetical protein